MDLSVSCVVYNGGEDFKKMIESVLPLQPEIIIVDQASTDETPEIAKRYASIYIKTTKKGASSFDNQYAISLCRRSWILMLDADECLTADLRKFIKNTLNKKKDSLQYPDIDVYWFSRKNLINGIDIKEILGLDFQARLWRRELNGREVLRRAPSELNSNVHQHPEISSARQAFIEYPQILHERQWKKVKTLLERHDTISSPQTKQIEQTFLNRVKALLGDRGELSDVN